MALYHSARGSVGYTIVGTPTIVDGVAKDFSLDNYLSLNSTITSFTELSISFIPGTYSSGRIVLFNTGVNAYRGSLNWASSSTARFTYTNTSNDGEFLTNIPYTEGKENILKIEYVSTNSVKLTLSRQGESDFIRTIADIDIPATFGGSIYLGRGTSAYNAFNGSIDLNKTYFIDNGQPFFGICPIEVKKHQLKGPVGYTVVGSPTITDGILNSITNDDKITLTSGLPTTKPFEIIIPIKYSSASSTEYIFSGTGFRLFVKNQSVTFNIQDDQSTNQPLVVTSNASYDVYNYIKIAYDGTTVSTAHSLDNSNYVAGESLVMTPYNRNTTLTFGSRGATYSAFSGEINLNFAYIKSNGKLWFWQPRETEKIVVNGVQVWQKSS